MKIFLFILTCVFVGAFLVSQVLGLVRDIQNRKKFKALIADKSELKGDKE